MSSVQAPKAAPLGSTAPAAPAPSSSAPAKASGPKQQSGTGFADASSFAGTRELPRPQDPAYAKLSAADKEAALFAEAVRTAYADLPALGSAGVGGGKTVWQKLGT